MEKAKDHLTISEDESVKLSRLVVPAHRPGEFPSFYESFTLKGIRVDQSRPGFIVCSFKVPPRLGDRNGNLATGAIANLMDEIGYSVVHVDGLPVSMSVNMSISYLSTAKVHDELEITSTALGKKGGYAGALVILKNKRTGEIVAEGRHSLFNPHGIASNI